ncbi:MAG: right-handed parallel beta-helix repeat-containing protein [Planctomycetota bacterium]
MSTFTRNTSSDAGGMYFNLSTVLVDRCVVQGNVAGGRGGGMLFDNSEVTVTNSVFVGNSAGDDAGGIAIRTGNNAVLENCTIVGNVAADAIGGVLVSNSSTSSLINTISTGNADAFGNVPDYGGTSTASAYGGAFSIVATDSLTPDAVFGDGIFTATPSELFTRVPDPGVDGEWGTLDDDYGDLTLLPTAPAIDAGSSVRYAGPLADLAGTDRAQDDPMSPDVGESFAAPIIDIGAFEVASGFIPSGCPGDADGNGRTETADLTFVVSNLGCQD